MHLAHVTRRNRTAAPMPLVVIVLFHGPGEPFLQPRVLADLDALAHHPVICVCAGAKAFLDLPRTLDQIDAAWMTQALAQRYPKCRFVWLMGSDNLAQLHRWKDWRGLARTMPIAVIARPGYDGAAQASPAQAWLDRFRRSAASIKHRAGWSAPALIQLRFDPDPRSATAIRRADPDWASRFSGKRLRDSLTHHPVDPDIA